MEEYNRIIKDLQSTYDSVAQERSRAKSIPWKVEERRRFLKELQLHGKANLLELGAGHGRDSLYFMKNGLQVTCVDLSAQMVELCQAKGLTAYQADFLSLPFTPHIFDAVFALNSLLHVPRSHLPRVLSAIKDQLKPGGLFYYGVYGGINHEGIWKEDCYENKRFFNYYPDQELLELVTGWFNLVYFRQVPMKDRGGLHFQSMILMTS